MCVPQIFGKISVTICPVLWVISIEKSSKFFVINESNAFASVFMIYFVLSSC